MATSADWEARKQRREEQQRKRKAQQRKMLIILLGAVVVLALIITLIVVFSGKKKDPEALNKLEQLKRMHDDGILSDEEYEKMRKELMDRI